MNETQLIQRLRGLDSPIDPSPRFADELFESLNRERQREGGRRFRIELPRLLQMAAASAAFLVILGIGWAFLAQPRGPAVTPVVVTSPSPTRSPSPQPSSSANPAATAAPISPTASRTLRPVGTDPGPDPNFQPWTMPWAGEVAAVVEWHDGLVAVGNKRGTGGDGSGEPGAGALWTSDDGQNWQSVELPDDMSRADLVAGYVASDGQLVVLRADVGPASTSTGWTSTNGMTWSSIPTPRVFTPIVVGQPGVFSMIDTSYPDLAWTSADGITWERLDMSIFGSGQGAADVAVGDQGRILVTCELETDTPAELFNRGCRTWASADGSNWLPSDPLPSAVRVAWFGDEWVAAGRMPDGPGVAGADDVIRLWRSVDGVTWTPTSEITEGFVNSNPERLFAAGDHLVLRAGTSFTRTFVCNLSLICQLTGIEEIITHDAAADGNVVVLVGTDFGVTGETWSWDTAAD